jgi:hypothetical protein
MYEFLIYYISSILLCINQNISENLNIKIFHIDNKKRMNYYIKTDKSYLGGIAIDIDELFSDCIDEISGKLD